MKMTVSTAGAALAPKPKRENRKTRNRNASIALAITSGKSDEVEAEDKLGGGVSLPEAQPNFNFDGVAEPCPRDKFTWASVGNRIQFANRADLYSAATPGKAVPKRRRSSASVQQLTTAPALFPAGASVPSLPARASTLFRAMIPRLTQKLFKPSHSDRRLKLLEIQQFGEKRFLAIARVGKQEFLIGGAASSVSLLAEINSHSATAILPLSVAMP
jgi:hypothetical protein